MRFWDTSAVVPLVVDEPASRACRAELRVDPAVAVWCLTRVEVVSALRRQQREGSLSEADFVGATRRLERLAERWTEVAHVELVAGEAVALLGRYRLRAADALQLGAARALVLGRTRGRVFLTGDDALGAAAAREGFRVIVPGPG